MDRHCISEHFVPRSIRSLQVDVYLTTAIDIELLKGR